MIRITGLTAIVFYALALQVQSQSGTPARGTSAPGGGMDKIGITSNLALGDVSGMDAPHKQIRLKTIDGEIVVMLGDEAVFKKVAPGQTDLKNAVPIALAEIDIGDRIIAMGRVSEDRRFISAYQVILMTREDIAEKQRREREEWRRRGIAGRVTNIDPERMEVTMAHRTRDGESLVIVAGADGTKYRRYAPGSVKFSDARASSLGELKVGDQLRAKGGPSEDGSRFIPEEIVFGSFRTIGGTIKSIDPSAMEVVIDEFGTGKPVTIVINQDSMLRQIPPEMAAGMARVRAMRQSGAAGGENPRPGPPSGPPGGSPRQRMGGEIDDMVERLPAVTLEELKQATLIVVSCAPLNEPDRVLAVKLLTGVEPMLAQPTGRPSMGPSFDLPGFDSIGPP